MISIKKYLDLDSNELNQIRPPSTGKLLSLVLEAYRSALNATANSALQVCPPLGPGLQRDLMLSAEELTTTLTPPHIEKIEKQVEQQLDGWAKQTGEYFQQRAGDVKEILMMMAHAAEAVAERDRRYATQFGEFTKRLQALAKLEDLPQIRAAIARGAKELKTCVDSMEQDGRESVAALRSQVSAYQTKLEEAERRASRDALTGLENRHAAEERIERRIHAKQHFCVVMLDLNGFKRVNDTYGHQAGDDLLKQFSLELRSASRATDTIGRWGGDEFIVVLDGTLAEAQAHVERMRKWVFGKYTLQLGLEGRKVEMNAALGLAEWQPGESIKDVLARADALMYKQKADGNRQRSAAPPVEVS